MALHRIIFENGAVAEYDDAVATREDTERWCGGPGVMLPDWDWGEVNDGKAQVSE